MGCDDADDFLDVHAAVYTSLDEVDAKLAHAWRERFLDRFFAESELSEKRRNQARGMLRLARGVAPDATLVLRIEFPFMGSTEWHEWDGTESAAIKIAEDVGRRQGHDVGYDQARGPTGWEVEFD